VWNSVEFFFFHNPPFFGIIKCQTSMTSILRKQKRWSKLLRVYLLLTSSVFQCNHVTIALLLGVLIQARNFMPTFICSFLPDLEKGGMQCTNMPCSFCYFPRTSCHRLWSLSPKVEALDVQILCSFEILSLCEGNIISPQCIEPPIFGVTMMQGLHKCWCLFGFVK
jgi:hypothetical protein